MWSEAWGSSRCSPATGPSPFPPRPVGRCAWALRSSAPAGFTAEVGDEPVSRAGPGCRGDRRAEQGVPAGLGDEQGGDGQQADGQCARDWPALAARLGYIPSVHGDLDGSRAFDGDGGEREVADVEYLVPAPGGGMCGEEPVGPVAQ